MLEKLIEQFGKEFNMKEEILMTEDRHYKIPLDNGIEIETAELERSCLLKGIIGSKPEKNVESFLLKVMEANLFGIGTRGGAIGLLEDGKQLTYSLEIDNRGSYKNFKEKIEDFISVVDFWRKETLKHE